MNGPMSVELLGLVAVAIMVISYALERRHHLFVVTFAAGCALAAAYAYLIGSYPFLLAEGLWLLVALRRWRERVDEEL